MKKLFNQAEKQSLIKSVVLMFALFIFLWIPFNIFVAFVHGEAVAFRWYGGSINTAKLDKYDQAKEICFYFSIGLSFLLSQSVLWIAALSRQKQEIAE